MRTTSKTLTSNPAILDHALEKGGVYDDALGRKPGEGQSGEASFFEIAIENLHVVTQALRPQPRHRRTRFARRQLIAKLHHLRHHDEPVGDRTLPADPIAGGGHDRAY
jgi:hypothetical protein